MTRVHTTVRSWPAMAIAGVILAGTGYVLFHDIQSAADIKPSHVLTGLAILIGTAASHYTAVAWHERRFAIVAGLLLLTAGSLAYIASTSFARNVESGRAKVAGIVKSNDDRRMARLAYDGTQAELDRLGSVRTPQQVRASMDQARVPRWAFEGTKQCTDVVPGSDAHRACKPILDLREEMAGAIRKQELEAKREAARLELARMGPELAGNAGLSDLAQLMHLVIAVAPAVIERYLGIALPGLSVLLAEIGVIVFGNLAVSHTVVRQLPAPAALPLLPAPIVALPPATVAGNRGNSRQPLPTSRDAAARDLATLLTTGKPLPSQDWLAQRWRVHKGTVSKWLLAWEADGIVARQQSGRRKTVKAC